MKSKFLKISNSCSENWEKMESNANGSYCEVCSKNVVDLTNLNQDELTKKMMDSDGDICARITDEQMNEPLLNFDIQKQFRLPYSNVAAGLLIASSLIAGQTSQAKNEEAPIEFVERISFSDSVKNKITNPKKVVEKQKKAINFRGTVKVKKSGRPIENAEVSFVTVDIVLIAYTDNDGSFSLSIPEHLLKKENIVKVSYNNVSKENQVEHSRNFLSSSHILSKRQISSKFKIKAVPQMRLLGRLMGHYEYNGKPLVFNNGLEMAYNDFVEARKEDSFSYDLKNYYYLNSKYAVALCGEKAVGGAYILFDKSQK